MNTTVVASQSSPEISRTRKLPFAILLLAAGLFAAVMSWFFSGPDAEEFDPLGENVSLAYGPENFDAALEEIDKRLALNRERVDRDGTQWSYQERLANAHLLRAQLGAEFDDYLAASKAIDAAASLAPEGAGPGLSIAVVNLSLHRNSKAGEGVALVAAAAVPPVKEDRAEMEAIRGDLAFYQGNYLDARHHYDSAKTQYSEAVTMFRLASWHKYQGDFDQAIALYKDGARIAKSRTPQRFAVYLLQIGALELQQGNWDKARRYFERAEQVFPGYWLAQAHVAQMDAAEGNLEAAERAYLDIINRTDNPDVMAALIGLYEYQGRQDDAKIWSERAGTIWDKRVGVLPETYYDHAFDHAMSVGDTDAALALARKNYAARPYGDAAIGLARALVENDEPADAIALLDKQVASGWRSVELFAAQADAYASAGNQQKAAASKSKALAINPKAFDEPAELLAFGNH